MAAFTFTTTNDSRSRLHLTDEGATLCGATVTRRANAEQDSHKKACFFCGREQVARRSRAATPAPAPAEAAAPVEGEPVTIRVAEVLVAYLAENIGTDFAQAAERAEIRRAGRGATYHLPMGRELAEQVHGHLVERLGHKRTGLGIQRWRAERAVRMIAADLGQDA